MIRRSRFAHRPGRDTARRPISPAYRVFKHVLEHWEQVATVAIGRLQAGDAAGAGADLAHLEADVRRVLAQPPGAWPYDPGPWNGKTI